MSDIDTPPRRTLRPRRLFISDSPSSGRRRWNRTNSVILEGPPLGSSSPIIIERQPELLPLADYTDETSSDYLDDTFEISPRANPNETVILSPRGNPNDTVILSPRGNPNDTVILSPRGNPNDTVILSPRRNPNQTVILSPRAAPNETYMVNTPDDDDEEYDEYGQVRRAFARFYHNERLNDEPRRGSIPGRDDQPIRIPPSSITTVNRVTSRLHRIAQMSRSPRSRRAQRRIRL